MMSPSPPCPFPDILLMTKPTPDSHSCPEPTGVGAFGCCESISLPNPQPGVTPGCAPCATSCCHILPARGAGKGFATRSALSPGGLGGNPCGARDDVGWRERVRCCLEARLVLRDHRTMSSGTTEPCLHMPTRVFGERGTPDHPPQPRSLPQPLLQLPQWRGKGGGGTRGRVMGLGSGTTALNQGQAPHGSKGDEQGKCSACAWRVTRLLPGLWLLKLFLTLRYSGIPQGSPTLSAIDTWAFLSLEGFENLVESIPVAPVSSMGIFLHPPHGHPQEHPHRPPPPPHAHMHPDP